MSSVPEVSIANLSEWTIASSIVEMKLCTKNLRLCPELKYNVSGLDPYKVYTASIVLERVDDFKYSFQEDQWVPWSALDTPATPQTIFHTLGPQIGADWMAESIDFSWIMISRKPRENTFGLEAHHCYQPRLVLTSEGETFYLEDAIQKFIPVTNSNARLQKFKERLYELKGAPMPSRKRRANTSSQEPKPKTAKKQKTQESTANKPMEPIQESYIPPATPSFPYPAPSYQYPNYHYYPEYHYNQQPYGFPSDPSPMLQNHYYQEYPTSSQQSPTPPQYNSLTGSPTTSNASSDDLEIFNEFFCANPEYPNLL